MGDSLEGAGHGAVRAWCLLWRGGAGPLPLTLMAAGREESHTPGCSTGSPAAHHGVFHCHKPCFREPYGMMDPKTMQRAPLKPKRCCASLSSLAASLLCNSPSWSAPGPRHGWRVVRMEFHPRSLRASPPSCAQLSPLSNVPLWPVAAFPSGFLATARFPGLPGWLTALPRWGTSPM